jgi:hypothetical protein
VQASTLTESVKYEPRTGCAREKGKTSWALQLAGPGLPRDGRRRDAVRGQTVNVTTRVFNLGSSRSRSTRRAPRAGNWTITKPPVSRLG